LRYIEGMNSWLGHRASLVVRRIDADGVWLALGALEPGDAVVLLPPNELPEPLPVGGVADVFLYLDSDDRPIATTRTPHMMLGEVAIVTVADIAPFGAFVNWGLKKDLLIPLREQTRPLRIGDRCAVGLYIDDTGRLAGTMRVAEMLTVGGDHGRDAWVEGVAWREEPGLGLFVILEKRYLALLPASEPHALRTGDAARFRVTHVHPDRKVEVSLRGLKHEELDGDAERLLELLLSPSPPKLGDDSSPEWIRKMLGISKKAFKRAAGRLLRTRRVSIDHEGFLKPTDPPV
jgi:predicted RNA-binding protein (virulence factor B family)